MLLKIPCVDIYINNLEKKEKLEKVKNPRGHICLQSVPAYKEQLVAYCGVKILLNLSSFSGLEKFHYLYEGVDIYITFYI